MKNLMLLAMFAFMLFSCHKKEIAQKPLMGWNSYDCFGYGVKENQVKENADYLAKNLKPFGWEYVVVDYLWFLPDVGLVTDNNEKMYQSSGFKPHLSMDANGRLLPDTLRFPSASNGRGFKPLGDYVHGLGLKFGIHLMRGIPRQAVAFKTPILNSSYTAADVANVKDTCKWMNHMVGLDMAKPGAQQYLNSLFQMYASWGVDFVKIDDLSSPYHKTEIEGYRKAIDHCGRPIVFSTSPGETPVEQAEHIRTNANMWRLLGDLWDDWKALDHAFDVLARWNPYRTNGHWPDPDMLPLGKLSKYGPVGPERYTKFTRDEQFTLMTLWCITRSPLMFGGNLPENDSFTVSLLTNQEVLNINQNSTNNRLLLKGIHPVWSADAAGSTDKYLAVFNRDSIPASIVVPLDSLHIASCLISDLWNKKDLGTFDKTIQAQVNPHGCALFRLRLK